MRPSPYLMEIEVLIKPPSTEGDRVNLEAAITHSLLKKIPPYYGFNRLVGYVYVPKERATILLIEVNRILSGDQYLLFRGNSTTENQKRFWNTVTKYVGS